MPIVKTMIVKKTINNGTTIKVLGNICVKLKGLNKCI